MRPKPPEDPSPYPILTQTIDGPPAGGSPTDGSAGSPTRIAADAIRQVLGWRYRAEDLKGFKASLAKSFVPRFVDDSLTVYDWQRAAATTVDDTEISGALASFYSRTKVAIDQAVPLLNSLTPLKPDADPEDTEAIRSIVLDRLQSLPPTLAVPGGPPPQRVNMIFQLLLGETPECTHAAPEWVGGELGVLRDRFGLYRSRVNTIEEELNLTNYVIIVDYVASLHQTWTSQARFFNRANTAEPYLGNQMVLIKNQLEVVADSVMRARSAMESVYFNLAEQMATFLVLGPDEPPLTVAELLDWIIDGTQLKPGQLQNKDGIAAVRVVLEQLHTFVSAALDQSVANVNNSTRGFYTERVQLALDSLEASLLEALRLANQIHRGRRPIIQSVSVIDDLSRAGTKYAGSPNFRLLDPKVLQNKGVPGLHITGTGFHRNAVVRVNAADAPELTFQAVTVSLVVSLPDPNKVQVLLAAFKDSGASPTPWQEIMDLLKKHEALTITLLNPDGQSDLFMYPQNDAGASDWPPGAPSSSGSGPSPGSPPPPDQCTEDEKASRQEKAAAASAASNPQGFSSGPKNSGPAVPTEIEPGPRPSTKKS